MPKFLERKLKREYPNNPGAVYGTMNKLGVMHGSRETPKGERMEAKHVAKYKGEAHTYDSNRPKRQVKSSYKGAAGAAY